MRCCYRLDAAPLGSCSQHSNVCRLAAGDGGDESLAEAYRSLWGVLRLPAVLQLSVVLVTCRLAFLPAEAAAPLKLLKNGVSKVRHPAAEFMCDGGQF